MTKWNPSIGSIDQGTIVTIATDSNRPSRNPELTGVVIVSNYKKSLVDFPASERSGMSRERMWIDNDRLFLKR